MGERQDTPQSALIDLILVIVFYVLAVASVVTFFWGRAESPRLFIYLGLGAVAVRIVYYVKKFFFTQNK